MQASVVFMLVEQEAPVLDTQVPEPLLLKGGVVFVQLGSCDLLLGKQVQTPAEECEQVLRVDEGFLGWQSFGRGLGRRRFN